jgi:hypothetical protein
MKWAIIFLPITVLIVSCKSNNVLAYRKHQFFSEYSFIKTDSVFNLIQTANYNDPSTIDEEYSHILTLSILDTNAAKNKLTLNLQTDTAIVKVTYSRISVWNWSKSTYPVEGKIDILLWGRNTIKLMENVKVYDNHDKAYRFVGTRTFKFHI